jgi:trehalose utilization protein
MMNETPYIRVHVWAEDRPLPQAEAEMRRLYPQGIEGAVAGFLTAQKDMLASKSVMADPEQGLSADILEKTDVLVFWSHKNWRELEDARVDLIQKRVLEGMGLIVLHSAHASKVFSRLMGTRTQCLRWREADEKQRYWLVSPSHPIARGLTSEYFEVPVDETYSEYFEIPQPDEQVFITSTQGGEVFRSGNCWYRGLGRIFYFQAGHETYPVYYQPEVQLVITNAVRWAAPVNIPLNWPNWARESGPVNLNSNDKR